MPRAGSSPVAALQSSRSAPASARSPANASTRASTRLTLPSRIATRSPKRERGDRRGGRAADPGQRGQRIAAARELAAVLGDDHAARRDGGCAPGCSSRARSRARARRRGWRRRGRARRESGRRSARSRPARSRPASAAASLPRARRGTGRLPCQGRPWRPWSRCQSTIRRANPAGRPPRRSSLALHRFFVAATGTASSKSGRSSLVNDGSVANGATSAYSRRRSAQLAGLRLELDQALVLRLDLVDAQLRARRRRTGSSRASSRRRLNALRRSRSCESTWAETALFQSSSSLLAFSNTTRSLEISMRRNCSMNSGCARRSARVRPRYWT